MDGLIGLLIFGLFFFLMMRFGCGAHIMHGGHPSDGAHEGRSGSKVPGRDPVCGMDVAADTGYSKSWDGTTYRFCSRDCLDKFEATPAKFGAPAAGKA